MSGMRSFVNVTYTPDFKDSVLLEGNFRPSWLLFMIYELEIIQSRKIDRCFKELYKAEGFIDWSEEEPESYTRGMMIG